MKLTFKKNENKDKYSDYLNAKVKSYSNSPVSAAVFSWQWYMAKLKAQCCEYTGLWQNSPNDLHDMVCECEKGKKRERKSVSEQNLITNASFSVFLLPIFPSYIINTIMNCRIVATCRNSILEKQWVWLVLASLRSACVARWNHYHADAVIESKRSPLSYPRQIAVSLA